MDLFGHARQGGHQVPALRGRPADHQDLRLPSCWNGLTTDSANHAHVVFPNSLGACPVGTFPVPQLHMELSYSAPSDMDYTTDTFPRSGTMPSRTTPT
jgi:hypothetical protein